MSNPISKLFTSWALNLIRLVEYSVKHATLFFTHREIQCVIWWRHIILIISHWKLLSQNLSDEQEKQHKNRCIDFNPDIFLSQCNLIFDFSSSLFAHILNENTALWFVTLFGKNSGFSFIADEVFKVSDVARFLTLALLIETVLHKFVI